MEDTNPTDYEIKIVVPDEGDDFDSLPPTRDAAIWDVYTTCVATLLASREGAKMHKDCIARHALQQALIAVSVFEDYKETGQCPDVSN